MNIKAVIPTIMAMSMITAGFAFAQDNGNRNDRSGNENAQQEKERGAGPNHQYHRGDRLPASEHTKQYVVNDWRGHNLRAPPNGYHWVQSGDDFVLVAIATGVIADLLLSR